MNYVCEATTCNDPAVAACDICDHYFCENHGQKGGDRYVPDFGDVAVPSICEVCLEQARGR